MFLVLNLGTKSLSLLSCCMRFAQIFGSIFLLYHVRAHWNFCVFIIISCKCSFKAWEKSLQ